MPFFEELYKVLKKITAQKKEVFIKDFFSKCDPTTNLVTPTQEILNEKFHFFVQWSERVFLSVEIFNNRVGTNRINETEAAIQRCSYEKVFWKYAANLQGSTHAKVWFQ